MSNNTLVRTEFGMPHIDNRTLINNGIVLEPDICANKVVHYFDMSLPQVIDSTTRLDDAILIFNKTHQRTLFVIDDNFTIRGVISKARLSSSYVLRIAKKMGLKRDALTLSDVMVCLDDLPYVARDLITQLTIKDVLKLMEDAGQEHLLVIDKVTGELCGYVDFFDLVQSLQFPIQQVKQANTFSKIVDSLWHHTEL